MITHFAKQPISYKRYVSFISLDYIFSSQDTVLMLRLGLGTKKPTLGKGEGNKVFWL